MDFRTQNGFKDTQVILKELSLYGGDIDGIWGSKSASGVVALMRSYAEFIGRGVFTAASMPVKATADGKNIITQLQDYMKDLGVYLTSVDGVWGKGSLTGLELLAANYRRVNKLPAYDMAWSKKVSKEFRDKIYAWCSRQGYDPIVASWLMACMHFESGGTFSPSKQNNGGSNFFGLIQFGDDAAKDLGTTLGKLVAMTQLEQLDYVFKYFEMWGKRGKKYTQLEDFYLAIFYPAAVGKKADAILFRERTEENKQLISDFEAKAFIQNKGFDRNKDRVITVGEICTTIYNTYYTGMDPVNRLPLL
jgi:hypothetical protein